MVRAMRDLGVQARSRVSVSTGVTPSGEPGCVRGFRHRCALGATVGRHQEHRPPARHLATLDRPRGQIPGHVRPRRVRCQWVKYALCVWCAGALNLWAWEQCMPTAE